ncbi:hypothetical protein pdul_cds_974 [Pandoravirus dulcis]|uniref:Uncharacterized protein n=1 Tax=Pandoravirus dulcis TaxID=1349409 RepID=S4VSF0_9VIRU|nr:hypothetical protein pdul_cds_974 [Pandoravirus dulcis]AGO83232.1 hypothetical protein pdul_cds_974 [Pandoravirus dulcis]
MAHCGAVAQPLAYPPPVQAWTGDRHAQFLRGNSQYADAGPGADDSIYAPSRWWACSATGDCAHGAGAPAKYILCADDDSDHRSDSDDQSDGDPRSDSDHQSDSGDDSDDDDDWDDGSNDQSGEEDGCACPVAPARTPYAYGYSFIEGLMPAESFDALVRPGKRLVVMVGAVPVALDAAEVERAGNAGRALVTPLGSCALGPLDVERAHKVDEALYEREGLRRFLTTAPVSATIEAAAPALGASAGAAADIAGGGILAGVLGGLFAALL